MGPSIKSLPRCPDKDVVLTDDAFDSGISAFNELEDITFTLRATALEKFEERSPLIPLLAFMLDGVQNAQSRISGEERLHLQKRLPKLHKEYQTRVDNVETELGRLQRQGPEADQTLTEILIAMKNHAATINSATTVLLNLANATASSLGKRKTPNRSPEKDPLASAERHCTSLGEALTDLDRVMDDILERCNESYEEHLKWGYRLEKATRQREVEQDATVLRELPRPLEVVQQRRAAFTDKMREVKPLFSTGAAVDNDIWKGLMKELERHLKRSSLFEKILHRAAIAVLKANAG